MKQFTILDGGVPDPLVPMKSGRSPLIRGTSPGVPSFGEEGPVPRLLTTGSRRRAATPLSRLGREDGAAFLIAWTTANRTTVNRYFYQFLGWILDSQYMWR